MCAFAYVTLRERPEFMEAAAQWFHTKWGVPKKAYLACMTLYLKHETEYDGFSALTKIPSSAVWASSKTTFTTERTCRPISVPSIQKRNTAVRASRGDC